MTVFASADGEEETDKEVEFEHPSFGMIELHHRSGSEALFGVDYPTGHSTSIRISTGTVRRSLSGEWFYAKEIIAEIEMSEVQFARFIATPNTSGMPCTLRQVRKGQLEQVERPPEHMASAQTWKNEARDMARKIGGNLDHMRAMIKAQQESGKTPTKKWLDDLGHWAQQTQQAIQSDLPFMAGRMEESVDEATQMAKAEVDAYIHHQLEELGRKAVAGELRKGGVAIRLGGERKALPKPHLKKDAEDGE
jgi:hypothetical protein